MKNPWAHRCAILLAILALIVIALGAGLTSEIRTLPGATPSNVSAPSLEQAHRVAGYAVAVLTIGLAIWISSLSSGGAIAAWSATAAWIAGAAVIVECLLGSVPAAHAVLAPVYFSALAATAVVTSKGWQSGPQPVSNQWGPLRALGMGIPVLVLIQIGLGAAFRHNAMGVLWHILDALIVLLAVLVGGVFVLRQYPGHPSLRPAALTLLIVAGVQVLLGFAVYLVLLMSSDNNSGLIVTGVLHVINGSLTLAASVALALQINRNLIQLSGV